MTEAIHSGPRILTLDFMRGIAVMGILLMNIVDFGLPQEAVLNPNWHGSASAADYWSWFLSFVLVQGKMRGLFSLLFGAGMLLVIERAEAAGLDGGEIHKRRMLWLLLFGLAHFFFIWRGDILSHYAASGMVAYLLHHLDRPSLLRWAIGMFALDFFLASTLYGSSLMLQLAAAAPGADAATVRQWELLTAAAQVSAGQFAQDIALHQGSYGALLRHQLNQWPDPIYQAIFFGPEALGFMLLGMWSLKSGFLSGDWKTRSYRNYAIAGLAIGVPAFSLLAWLVHRGGYDPILSLNATLAGGALFRPIMTFGYAALIVLLARRGAASPFGGRIAAAGQAAFTNYLGTSIVATFIFYGWGLGLYGTLGRTELYLIAFAICAAMLLWSKPWLDRFRYGPFEWLWRSLARGSLQPMRKRLT